MTTFEKLIEIFKSVFDNGADTSVLTEDSRLKEDVGINSIGMLYMAMAIEGEFGVQFKNEDFANLVTVGDVAAIIESKL